MAPKPSPSGRGLGEGGCSPTQSHGKVALIRLAPEGLATFSRGEKG